MKGMIPLTCHTCHTAFPLNLLMRILFFCNLQMWAHIIHCCKSDAWHAQSKCVNVFIVNDIFDRCWLLWKYKFHHRMSQRPYNCHLFHNECQNHTLLYFISFLFFEHTVRSSATKIKCRSNQTVDHLQKNLKELSAMGNKLQKHFAFRTLCSKGNTWNCKMKT